MDRKNKIYRILSAIINLGNIQFETTSNENSCYVTAESQRFLDNVATLLCVNKLELEVALTSKIIETKNITIRLVLEIPNLQFHFFLNSSHLTSQS